MKNKIPRSTLKDKPPASVVYQRKVKLYLETGVWGEPPELWQSLPPLPPMDIDKETDSINYWGLYITGLIVAIMVLVLFRDYLFWGIVAIIGSYIIILLGR